MLRQLDFQLSSDLNESNLPPDAAISADHLQGPLGGYQKGMGRGRGDDTKHVILEERCDGRPGFASQMWTGGVCSQAAAQTTRGQEG